MAQQQAQRKAEKMERMGIQGQPGSGGLASANSDMLMGGDPHQQAFVGLGAPALSMPAMGSFGVQFSGGSFGAHAMPPPSYQPAAAPAMISSPFMPQHSAAAPGYGAPPPPHNYGMPGGPSMFAQPMMPAPVPISVPQHGGAYGSGPGSFGAGGGMGSPTGMGSFGGQPSPNSYGAGEVHMPYQWSMGT